DWEKVPDFSKLQPKATGEVAGFDLGVAARKDNIGFRFEGFFKVTKDGTHKFTLGSDDGSKLYVDDELIVDNDDVHAIKTENGKTRLFVGVHSFRVDGFNGGGDAELKVSIEPPGLGRQDLGSVAAISREGSEAPSREFKLEAALVERGRQLFTTVGCASCHEL